MAPIVRSLPSYAKDSQHTFQIFRDFNFLGEDKLIFTMDITSLYTVFPNGEGLLALKHLFDLRNIKEPNSETELVLTLNCFSFADKYYKQINGVAMETKNGTRLRQSFRRYIEHQFFYEYIRPKPELYRRYFLYQRRTQSVYNCCYFSSDTQCPSKATVNASVCTTDPQILIHHMSRILFLILSFLDVVFVVRTLIFPKN